LRCIVNQRKAPVLHYRGLSLVNKYILKIGAIFSLLCGIMYLRTNLKGGTAVDAQEAMRKYELLHYYTQSYSPRTYSLDETAKILNVKPETVLSYIAVNDLTAELVGSSYRIAVDDLEDFLWIRTMGIVAYRDMSYSNL
jgi:excisionase family DNA binding protein